MRTSLRTLVRVMVIGGAGFAALPAVAQLKVGTNPTTINKSAVLELESKKQGLLLPRLDDFTQINNLGVTIPDGMIVYKLSAADGVAGLYIRKGGNWVLMNSADDGWGRNGNAAQAGEFIGTTNPIPFSIRANNIEGIVVDNGYTFLKKLDQITTGLDVLIVDPTTGKVSSRTIAESAFANAINKLNGLTDTDQKLTTAAATSATPDDYKFTTSGTDTHVLTIATQDGTAGVGLLTKDDYNSFKLATQLAIGAFDGVTSNPDGLSIVATPGNAPKLVLHAADATNPGAVSTSAQTFEGAKTFIKTIAGNEDLTIAKKGTFGTGLTVTSGGFDVTGTSVVDGSLTVTGTNGNLSVAGTTTVSGATVLSSTLDVSGNATLAQDLHVIGHTVLDQGLTLTNIADGTTENTVLLRDATGNVVKRTLSSTAFTDLTFASDHAGTDLAVAEDANSKVTISIPIAAPTTTGGLVSNTNQSFAGAKKFGNEVSIQKNVSIGDTTNAANSTLQVTGSVSMSIVKVENQATYNVAATDNTLLVKSSAASRLNLPAANTCTGRVYTIKKIPNGTDDSIISNEVVIAANGTDTIEGGSTLTIYNDWTFYTIQSDGSAWYVIKK
ncbi:hypothetical protein ACDQ55_12750 [Chitinophaga sp. 30R24]|uniref:hypothetical protein n=1 Tax=Chitinophaga sp. 30R24 TaxID=3248838 RepID=UPI003B8FEEAB